MADETVQSRAWLLKGPFNDAGVLALADHRLSFTGKEGPVFDVPLSQVSDVRFPWYYFGGGVKLRVEGKRYRVSFVRPNGARAPEELAAFEVAGKVADMGEGRRSGKVWREILTKPTP